MTKYTSRSRHYLLITLWLCFGGAVVTDGGLEGISMSTANAQILFEDPTQTQTRPLPKANFAENEDVESQTIYEKPKTGKNAATDYFKARQKVAKQSNNDEEASVTRSVAAGGDRVMSLHLGSFINDKQYRWGRNKKSDDAGEMIAGVTYRLGEWVSSMDLNFRAEIMTYEIDGEKPLKLVLGPVVQFPDARSDFPIYFGAGIGVGVFFEQVGDESDLSFDYSLIIGTRFWDLFPDGGGLIIETGLKGHVHVLSSGQQEGVFLTAGGIFTF